MGDRRTSTIKVNGKQKLSTAGEWNYFGGNGSYFTQYTDPDKTQGIDRRTRITGGMITPRTARHQDPLIGSR